MTVHSLMSMSRGLMFLCVCYFFNPAQKNLLYRKPDCVSYRHRTPVGARFCLIRHFLTKPEMFLSSALLLLVTHFTIIIC